MFRTNKKERKYIFIFNIYLDVKAIDANSQIVFIVNILLASVEFFAFVNVLATCLTPVTQKER